MPEKVTLTLANPLTADQAARVLAEEVRDYRTGEKITVRRDYALSVINAGYAAGIDPANTELVNQALSGPAEPPLVPQADPVDHTGPKDVPAKEEDGKASKPSKK